MSKENGPGHPAVSGGFARVRRPTWLDNVHARPDAAVSDAYGWPADLAEGEILERAVE
ncbi:MAG: hypothetical protein OXL37_04580 [Chloroflexota bacterium]|nr:hypothetical protein [Chloroflexota bacterium]MDE2960987.1 hypothetical protein [Chloroflexota bacterium]